MNSRILMPVAIALALAATSCGCANLGQAKPLNLAAIPDGTYSGEAQVFVVSARVEVTMKGGAIEAFVITKHFSSKFGKPAEVLAQRVVEKQSLELDAVSGATLSSKAILGAGKSALASARH